MSASESRSRPERLHTIIGEPDAASGAPAAQPTDAPTARVRSTLTVAEDGQSVRALWERSDDGTNWQPWMDIAFTRRG